LRAFSVAQIAGVAGATGQMPAFKHGDLEIRLSPLRLRHICACSRAVAT
jgi:hypothetical protein